VSSCHCKIRWGNRRLAMKKAGIGFLLLVSAAFLGAQAAPQTVAAVIREVSGTVETKAPGAAEWKAAAAGQELDTASLISTGFRSTALVGIGNSTVTVHPLTRLSLEEIAEGQNGDTVTLNLRTGRIRADVKPPAGRAIDFSVRSPVATASVRGTVFEFDGLRLSVEEGRVHLGGQTVTGAYVGAGHSTAADPETGKTAAVIERVKEEMVPALPAGSGANTAPSGPAAAVPVSADLGIGFRWGEE
jgi:hypothetical protein